MQEAHGARMHINDFTGKRVHMIGIGGSSMSGLAGLLARRGFAVTGSDNYDSYHVQAVRESGIPVTIGHQAENVHGAALVIYSAAIAPDNPERQEAARLGIPQMERATLLGQLMEGYAQAAGISGTHGKRRPPQCLRKSSSIAAWTLPCTSAAIMIISAAAPARAHTTFSSPRPASFTPAFCRCARRSPSCSTSRRTISTITKT